MPNAPLVIDWAERCILAGKTGSGKTFLARHLLAPIPRLIVLDPKGTLAVREWRLEEWTPDAEKRLLAGKAARIRVPSPFDGDWTPALDLAWRAGNLVIYSDEIYGVVEPYRRPPAEFLALYTRGRERGIGAWGATQRPVAIPLFAITEAGWFFVFRLQNPEDRVRMAQYTDPIVEEAIPKRDRWGFWTFYAEWDSPIYTPQLVTPNGR